jgi:signal transduction histidine kinase
MLHDFLAAQRDELVRRCKLKAASRSSARHPTTDLDHGIPLLIAQLVETLRVEDASPPGAPYAEVPHAISDSASIHGADMLREGFTLDQVVHDYGDLCQAITELAHDEGSPITVDEFHTFNRCLDSAIANAVTEFGRLRDKRVAEAGVRTHNDRLALLATELRTSVNAAMLSFSAIKSGRVAVSGHTGSLLDRSLTRLSDIVERTLSEVRLNYRKKVTLEVIELPAFLEHLSVFAVLEAASKTVDFTISVPPGLVINADLELLSSAIAILRQNALRFTPAGGHISLRATEVSKRILIEVADECDGLAPTALSELDQLLGAESADPSRDGVSICRYAVNLTGGTLGVKDLPHHGCVFTIDLPMRASS